VPVASTTTATTTPSTGDPELEKRKQRAERFGIPIVEAKQKNAKQPSGVVRTCICTTCLGLTVHLKPTEQLDARAKRFGINPKPNEKKRSAQTEDIDPEELERRKKRAERFGLPVARLSIL
jgi:SAP domain-containing ribonucleoprotein